MFDYYLCGSTNKWIPWTEKLPIFELDPEIPLQVLPIILTGKQDLSESKVDMYIEIDLQFVL